MAQKTFEEILSESTELKLTDKFKDKIFEFSNDVNAMGIVVNTREDGNSKFFFKDQKYTKPVTDNELLAMYLDEVVPTRLVDNNKSLERIRDLKSEKLKFLEYKADDITKKFYKIGNYFSGETYIFFHDGSEDEKPATQTIWEGTFTAERSGGEAGGIYYSTQDIQNSELIKNCSEVTVTFDGSTYVLPVEPSPFGYGVGPEEPSSDCPFSIAFMVESPSSTVLKYFNIGTLTEGEHTIKVEGAPSGDEPSGDTMRVLYDGEVTGGTVKGDFVYKNAFLSELASMANYTQATITVNNESKTILPVIIEPQGDYGKNYILGMDAYPPTELPHDVGVAVVYEVNGKDPTSGGSYSSYIITPSRSKGTPVTSLKVEVDENDKRGDR